MFLCFISWRVVLKILDLRFYHFWCSPFRSLFVFFWCHFVKSHQSHSPLCSFFNLQKHTQKKNENQRDIIFRTTLKRFTPFSLSLLPMFAVSPITCCKCRQKQTPQAPFCYNWISFLQKHCLYAKTFINLHGPTPNRAGLPVVSGGDRHR